MAIGKTPTARENLYIYTVVAGNLNYCTHINICWTACFYWQILYLLIGSIATCLAQEASYLIGLIPFFAEQISIILLQPPFLQVRLNLTGTGYTHVFHICFASQSNELPISNGNIPPVYYTSIPSGVFTIFHGSNFTIFNRTTDWIFMFSAENPIIFHDVFYQVVPHQLCLWDYKPIKHICLYLPSTQQFTQFETNRMANHPGHHRHFAMIYNWSKRQYLMFYFFLHCHPLSSSKKNIFFPQIFAHKANN
jgi:hypothetical protein